MSEYRPWLKCGIAGGKPPWPYIDPGKALRCAERKTWFALARDQADEVRLALPSKAWIITGGRHGRANGFRRRVIPVTKAPDQADRSRAGCGIPAGLGTVITAPRNVHAAARSGIAKRRQSEPNAVRLLKISAFGLMTDIRKIRKTAESMQNFFRYHNAV